MVNNPIFYAAIMILWLVALPGFLTISCVSRIVHIMSLVVPATVFTYFGFFGSHYNSSVDSVKSRLQNMKSQYLFMQGTNLLNYRINLGFLFDLLIV